MNDARTLLEGVKAGTVSIDEALLELRKKPFEDIGFAKVDLHRRLRQGAAEVIYGQGKTPEQIIGMDWLAENIVGAIPDYEELNETGKATVDMVGVGAASKERRS